MFAVVRNTGQCGEEFIVKCGGKIKGKKIKNRSTENKVNSG